MSLEDLLIGAVKVAATAKKTLDQALENATTPEQKQALRYEQSVAALQSFSQRVVRMMGDASLARKDLERMEATVTSLETSLRDARAEGQSTEQLDALQFRIAQAKEKIERQRAIVAAKQNRADEARAALDRASSQVDELRNQLNPTADGAAAAEEAIAAAQEASRAVARELAEARAANELAGKTAPRATTPEPDLTPEEALDELLNGGTEGSAKTASAPVKPVPTATTTAAAPNLTKEELVDELLNGSSK